MTIKLYTKAVCPKCALIKTMLTAMEIPFETVNADENEKAYKLVVDSGFMSFPVMDLDGELIGDIEVMKKKASELA